VWVSSHLFPFIRRLFGFGIRVARYDRDASRYHQGVYGRKRADLLAALDATLSPMFLGQLKNLHKTCLVAFKKEMLDGLHGEGYNFAEVVLKARARCLGRFETGAKEAMVEGTDWVWEDELESLKEEVGLVADQCRKDETKKMVNLIEVCGLFQFVFCSLMILCRGISRSKYRSL
jgi:hypothetical protein